MRKKYYIGLASTFHDPALAVVNHNGEIVFAESGERHYQDKRAIGCPPDSVVWGRTIIEKYCDPAAKFVIASSWSADFLGSIKKIFNFGLLDKPVGPRLQNVFARFLKMMLPYEDMRWIIANQLVSNIIAGKTLAWNLGYYFNNHKIRIRSYDHHHAHAVYACHASGFKDAVCVVVDGGGEVGSLSVHRYEKGRLRVLETHKGHESLGYYYSLLTKSAGFDSIRGEEWKVMGLAPYGQFNQKIYDLLSSMLKVEGCSIRYKQKFGKFLEIRDRLQRLSRREEDSPLESADLAYTGQLVYEEVVTELLNNIYRKYQNPNLVLTGGCALNSAYNGKILDITDFKRLFVPSCPGDDGNALGAALCAFRDDNPGLKIHNREITSPYLGSEISRCELQRLVTYCSLKHEKLPFDEICRKTARLLAGGKLVGWVQGRAEFGPRALGNRSILADPRHPGAKDQINAKVKFREEYRPFAPSILHEYGEKYFRHYQESPYMEKTLEFLPEACVKVPAVVHVNRTGRLQSVRKEWNLKYHALLQAFYELTDVPVILNTSFNVMGKPIIHSVNDALCVFQTTGLDLLVIEDYIFYK